MSDEDVFGTLDVGVPAAGKLDVPAGRFVESPVARGYLRQQGEPPRVGEGEHILKAIGGLFTVMKLADDDGCISSEKLSPVGDVGMLPVARSSPGLALATSRRFVGSAFVSPAFGIQPNDDNEVVWEIDYLHVSDISLLRKRSSSKPHGISITGRSGSAQGGVGVSVVDEIVLPSFRMKKARNLPELLTPVITAIFDHRVAAYAGDPEYLVALAEARASGWLEDPESTDLVVEIPLPPGSRPDPIPSIASGDEPEREPMPEPEPEPEPGPESESESESESDDAGDAGEDSAPGAAWYIDPDDERFARYWNGDGWTEARALLSAADDLEAEA